MNKSLLELHSMMVDQVNRRGYYPKDEKLVLLHIVEEVGELVQSVRKNAPTRETSREVADIFWHLLRFCEYKNIDLEEAYLEKFRYNESRSLPLKDE